MDIQSRLELIHALIRAYVPDKFWSLIDANSDRVSKADLSSFYDLFGGSQRLQNDTMEYVRFPGSFNKLGINLTIPSTVDGHIYKSLKNEPFMYKLEIFNLIQRRFESQSPTFSIFRSTLAYYIRTKQDQFGDSFELVNYREEDFKKIGLMILQIGAPKHDIKLPNKTANEVLEHIKKIVPANEYDPEYSTIFKRVVENNKLFPIKKNADLYGKLLWEMKAVFGVIEKFIEDRKEWFTPNERLKKPKNEKPIVRLFDGVGEKFVLGKELMRESGRVGMDLLEFKEELMQLPELGIVGFEELHEEIGGIMKDIEFVLVPIQRGVRRAVPIPSFNGKYCLLASDVFMSFILDQISMEQIFHGVSQDDAAQILLEFEKYENVLSQCCKGSILLDMDYIEPIAKNVTNLLKNYKKTGPSRKPRMKTTSSKVTPKIMEEHIVAAGLHKAFPDILGRVSCFENLNEMSNGNVFNVLLLVEHIQFVEVILNTKRIQKFLHQHGICTQHWMLCPYCTGIDLESSDSETESSEAENQDGEIQQIRKKISNQQQKILRLEITILKQKRTIQKLQRRVGK
ncbi:hypothetical protein L3Y34_006849 [Caenorhabditis briggsae]|uniref:DUF7809 domain-containing protein n=1 Tax=Caenorhabditis briggsae TaxID=6238 RepID=A0AAE9A0D6_CAEBR|nr:hypothetical protein L3Y34_006849 [Caenorhabditis briggsae]